VLALVFLVAAMVLTGQNRPELVLDADAFTERRLIANFRIRWDQLVPGGPPPPARRRPKALTIYRRVHPAYPATPHRMLTRRLNVDPAFLAYTIRCYAERPDLRSAIGTPAESARLQAAFATQR